MIYSNGSEHKVGQGGEEESSKYSVGAAGGPSLEAQFFCFTLWKVMDTSVPGTSVPNASTQSPEQELEEGGAILCIPPVQ